MIEALWSEHYRPATVQDCILPSSLSKSFGEMISLGSLPNMIFSGSSGLGKTTVARALCNELGLDYVLINGSEDSGIDVLRTKIRQFASTQSLTGNGQHKVVILDEADYLNASSTQPALRAFIEEFSDVCRFILTCNLKNRIIPALQSRCTCIDFGVDRKTLAKLAAKFHKRLKRILDDNGVSYDDGVLAEVIMRFAPDWRRVLNECQRHSYDGELSSLILSSLSDENISTLINYLKTKNFKQMRSWVAVNSDLDSSAIFRKIYDSLNQVCESPSIPQAVLILADYSYKDSFVADKEINMVACMTELMRDLKWK
jgi:DNA polymerase III delta prime subunit